MSLIWGGMFLLLLVELAVTVMLLVPMPEKVRAFLARSLRAIYHMKHVKYVGGATLAFVIIMFAEAFTDGTSASMEARNMKDTPDHQAYMRLFRSQRNMLLSGAVFVIAFILWRLLLIFGPEAKHPKAQPAETEAPAAEAKVAEKAAEKAAEAAEPPVVPPVENTPEDKKNN